MLNKLLSWISVQFIKSWKDIAENIKYMNLGFCHRHCLVRHPNSIQASTNQSQGQGSILLPPWAAVLPRLDAGSGDVKPTTLCHPKPADLVFFLLHDV